MSGDSVVKQMVERARPYLDFHREVESARRTVCPGCQFETPRHPASEPSHAPGWTLAGD
jgi:hypothetical protein